MPTSEKNEGAKTKKKDGTMSSKKIKVNPKLAIVQDVIALMHQADISELSFEQGGVKVHVRRGPGVPFQTVAAPAIMAAPGFAPPAVVSAPSPSPPPPSSPSHSAA